MKRPAMIPLLLLMAACLVAGIVLITHERSARLATGTKGGTALPIGNVLARALAKRHVKLEVMETAGGWENVDLVDHGGAELGLAFNDAPGGERVRSIAPLFENVLQIVVREEVSDVFALRGKKVSAGLDGSGTQGVTMKLLRAHGIDPEKEIALARMSHQDAAAAFAKGEIDAAFVLAGLPTPAVEQMLRVPGARLMSLGDPDSKGSAVDGMRQHLPFLTASVVPARTYGSAPEKAVGALGCFTVLVARDSVSEDVVFDVAQALFASKVQLVDEEPMLAPLSERFDPGMLRFPLHPGAQRYYQRDNPPFILQWADTISLAITVLALVWSGVLALRAHRTNARRKRVDAYYMEVQSAADAAEKATTRAELHEVRRRLHAIRRKAFQELADKKLAADESFTIFQDYLRSELQAIDGAMREGSGDAPSTT